MLALQDSSIPAWHLLIPNALGQAIADFPFLQGSLKEAYLCLVQPGKIQILADKNDGFEARFGRTLRYEVLNLLGSCWMEMDPSNLPERSGTKSLLNNSIIWKGILSWNGCTAKGKRIV